MTIAPSTPAPAVAAGAIYDRRETLAMFANGHVPPTVYGPSRPDAAREIWGFLISIRPCEDDVWVAALTDAPGLSRRVRAFRNGVEYLHEAYWGYGYVEEGEHGALVLR